MFHSRKESMSKRQQKAIPQPKTLGLENDEDNEIRVRKAIRR
jgi:hypothetical protein